MISYFVTIIFARSYRYLLLTFCSLLVGAFLFGGVVAISNSISSFFVQQGKVLVGGDVVLSSAQKIDTQTPFFVSLKEQGHIYITEYNAQAVFRNGDGSITVPASVRAVDNEFPLYGSVQLQDDIPFRVGQSRIYAESTFLEKIRARVGDTIYVGSTSFLVAGVILKEPDQASLGISFTPRVITSIDDSIGKAVDVVQSRATYKVFIRENPALPFTQEDIRAIELYAKENKLRFDDARNGPNNFVRGLSSVEDFASVVLAIALFLVAVNIGANLTYILARFKKTIALLKTFGATTRQIQTIYSIILGIVGITAGGLGAFLGVLCANSLLPLLSSYVDGAIPPTSLFFVSMLGGVSGLVLIIISSVPFFTSLKYVMPKQLLSSISTTNDGRKRVFSLLAYLPLPIFLGVLLFVISGSVMLALYSVAGLIVLFGLFMMISFVVIRYLYSIRTRFSLLFSSIISFLKWRGMETIITSASIMTALSGVFIVSAIEQNIITNVQGNISRSAPSLYLVDIAPSQLSRVKEIAGPTFTGYPIIRGRLLSIADRDMTTSQDRGITREFNMTYRDSMIDGEKLSQGVWHGTTTRNAVSFDKSFAEQVGGVTLGDTVTVFIQGIEVKAKITSIHESGRSQGTPFFYMIFSPDVLSAFPSSYFGTARLDSSSIDVAETRLGNEFPNVIPIETGKIIDTVNNLLTTIIFVVKIIGIPSIILGLMLVLVMTGQSLYERKGDVLVLRVFGLTKNAITRLFVAEAGVLIIIATSIAYVVAHILAYILNTFLFNFELFAFAVTPLYISAGILIITAVFSYTIAHSLVKTPLKKLLAEK